MYITFLGTSAANAYPIAFCACDNCERARLLGGPSLRKRSAILINDDLLIDMGPDIMAASLQHDIPLVNVRYCLQTHSHPDHLDPGHLLSRSPEYGVVGAPRLHFYASAGTLRRVADHFQGFYDADNLFAHATGERLNLTLHQLEALHPRQIGPYRVTALPANHDPAVESMLYAIQADGQCIFYGTDTAAFTAEMWLALQRLNMQFDLAIQDHTYGPGLPGSDHLSAQDFIEHIARMREEGLLTDKARAFATHISHEGNPPHPELAVFAAEHGYEIAYDGLTVECLCANKGGS